MIQEPLKHIMIQLPLVALCIGGMYMIAEHFKKEIEYERKEKEKLIALNNKLQEDIKLINKEQTDAILQLSIKYTELTNLEEVKYGKLKGQISLMEKEIKMFIENKIKT